MSQPSPRPPAGPPSQAPDPNRARTRGMASQEAHTNHQTSQHTTQQQPQTTQQQPQTTQPHLPHVSMQNIQMQAPPQFYAVKGPQTPSSRPQVLPPSLGSPINLQPPPAVPLSPAVPPSPAPTQATVEITRPNQLQTRQMEQNDQQQIAQKALTVTSGIRLRDDLELLLSLLQQPQPVIDAMIGPDPNISDQDRFLKITEFVEAIIRLEERYQDHVSNFYHTLLSSNQFQVLFRSQKYSSQLQKMLRPLEMIDVRRKKSDKQGKDLQKRSISEIGETYWNGYFKSSNTIKSRQEAIRTIINWSVESEPHISFVDAHRAVIWEMLYRQLSHARGRNVGFDIYNSDVNKAKAFIEVNGIIPPNVLSAPHTLVKKKGKADQDCASFIVFDNNGMPWLKDDSHVKPSELFGTGQPQIMPKSEPIQTRTITSKKASKSKSKSPSKVKKPLPAADRVKAIEDQAGVGTGPIDLITAAGLDQNTQQPTSPGDSNATVVSELSSSQAAQAANKKKKANFTVQQLSDSFKKGDKAKAPRIQLSDQPPSSYVSDEDYNSVGDVEKAILHYVSKCQQVLTGPSRTRDGKSKDSSELNTQKDSILQVTSGSEINQALTNLRRLCHLSPGKDIQQADQRYLWMVGLSQFIAGTGLTGESTEPDWVRQMRTILSWAHGRVQENEYAVVPLASDVQLPLSCFDENNWLPGDIACELGKKKSSSGVRGWLDDETIVQLMRADASSISGIRIIDPTVFLAWAHDIRYNNGEQADASYAPGITTETDRMVLIPLNLSGNHWTLGVIDLQRQWIYELNSLHAGTQASIPLLRWLLTANGLDHRLFIPPTDDRIAIQPRQVNGIDCGLWVIDNALNLMRRGVVARARADDNIRLRTLSRLYAYAQDYDPNETALNQQTRSNDRRDRDLNAARRVERQMNEAGYRETDRILWVRPQHILTDEQLTTLMQTIPDIIIVWEKWNDRNFSGVPLLAPNGAYTSLPDLTHFPDWLATKKESLAQPDTEQPEQSYDDLVAFVDDDDDDNEYVLGIEDDFHPETQSDIARSVKKEIIKSLDKDGTWTVAPELHNIDAILQSPSQVDISMLQPDQLGPYAAKLLTVLGRQRSPSLPQTPMRVATPVREQSSVQQQTPWRHTASRPMVLGSPRQPHLSPASSIRGSVQSSNTRFIYGPPESTTPSGVRQSSHESTPAPKTPQDPRTPQNTDMAEASAKVTEWISAQKKYKPSTGRGGGSTGRRMTYSHQDRLKHSPPGPVTRSSTANVRRKLFTQQGQSVPDQPKKKGGDSDRGRGRGGRGR